MKLRPSPGVWPFLLALSLLSIITPPAADGATLVLNGSILVTRSTDPEFSNFGLGSSKQDFVTYGFMKINNSYATTLFNNQFTYNTYSDTFFTSGTAIEHSIYGGKAYPPIFDSSSNPPGPRSGATFGDQNYGMVDIDASGNYESVVQFNLSPIGVITWLAVARNTNNSALSIPVGKAAIELSAPIPVPPVSTVPEPTSFLASLIVCCIGILYRRRPRRSA
jgi:hypothetical protein